MSLKRSSGSGEFFDVGKGGFTDEGLVPVVFEEAGLHLQEKKKRTVIFCSQFIFYHQIMRCTFRDANIQLYYNSFNLALIG